MQNEYVGVKEKGEGCSSNYNVKYIETWEEIVEVVEVVEVVAVAIVK